MCIFRGTYWLGQIAGQFFLFCCSENGKCVFCLIINFSGICICQSDEKAGIGIFIFCSALKCKHLQLRNCTGKCLCKNGGIRGQGYGTCGLVSCHHNIFNGLMKVKPKLGFIHKKTYTTDREKNDKKREDMSWYFLFFIHI